jgi:hypothetical protein
MKLLNACTYPMTWKGVLLEETPRPAVVKRTQSHATVINLPPYEDGTLVVVPDNCRFYSRRDLVTASLSTENEITATWSN